MGRRYTGPAADQIAYSLHGSHSRASNGWWSLRGLCHGGDSAPPGGGHLESTTRLNLGSFSSGEGANARKSSLPSKADGVDDSGRMGIGRGRPHQASASQGADGPARMMAHLSSGNLWRPEIVRHLSTTFLSRSGSPNEGLWQSKSEAATTAHLGLDNLADRALHMRQTCCLTPDRCLSIGSALDPSPSLPHSRRTTSLTSSLRSRSHLDVGVRSANAIRNADSPPTRQPVSSECTTALSRTPEAYGTHLPQRPVTAQCVLGDRALGSTPHRSAPSEPTAPYEPVCPLRTSSMRRSHHPSANPSACPVLVRSNLGMPSSYRLPQSRHRHTCTRYSVTCGGHRGDVGLGNIHSRLLEHPSTSGTVVGVHRHIHWRPRRSSAEGGLR